MTHSVSDLAQACGGKIIQAGDLNQGISKLLIDSRQLTLPAQSLFFAFQGHRQNGHQFVFNLYRNGVRAFVISSEIDFNRCPNATFIVVDDTLVALQSVAKMHRDIYQIPVIGITGSNGKTIVKEWLFHLLQQNFQITKNPKSYNSQIGVALSVWMLNENTELGIFEAGLSQPNEMTQLAKLIQPTIGVFTNIGSAHAEGFVDRRQKIDEKLELFKNCEKLIYCLDHLEITNAVKNRKGTVTWSRVDQGADVYITSEKITTDQTIIELVHREKSEQIILPFIDVASVENALHCLTAALVLGVDCEILGARFLTLSPVRMRLEIREGIQNSIVINDTYNADLESLSVALATTNHHGHGRTKTIIISDFLQQVVAGSSLYSQIAELISSNQIDRVIGIGKEIPQIIPYLPSSIDTHFYPDTQSLLTEIAQFNFSNQAILVKGARLFELEKIARDLSRQKHSAVLEINLGALARNLKAFEEKLNHGVKLMAMVKANAYGSGSLEITKFLQTRNVDYLGVAYADEGVVLRKNNCFLPIMVLNPEEESIPLLTEYNLEPEVYALYQLKQIQNHVQDSNRPLSIHLKLETGMNRLGFANHDIDQLIKTLKGSHKLKVKSIFSHLASSDDPAEKSFSLQQIAKFEQVSSQICQALAIRPLRHILNSNGIHYFPQAQYDMVRLGIGIYGIGMSGIPDLERVHHLKTKVSHLTSISPGETIGYGRTEKATEVMTVATVGIGYADGLIRKAGNRRYALVVNGSLAPIVGNVCMDMTMLDVTEIEGVQVGSEVTVFGPHCSIEILASAADTIPYEILTSLSPRIKRIYIND